MYIFIAKISEYCKYYIIEYLFSNNCDHVLANIRPTILWPKTWRHAGHRCVLLPDPLGLVNVADNVQTPHPKLCPVWFRRGLHSLRVGASPFTQGKGTTQRNVIPLLSLRCHRGCGILQHAVEEIFFSAGVGDNCGNCLILKHQPAARFLSETTTLQWSQFSCRVHTDHI